MRAFLPKNDCATGGRGSCHPEKAKARRVRAGFRMLPFENQTTDESVVRQQHAVVLVIRRTAIGGARITQELVGTGRATPENHITLRPAEGVLLEFAVAITVQDVLAIFVVIVAVALLHIAGRGLG